MRIYRENRWTDIHSIYMTFGSAVHAALETLKDPSLKNQRPPIDVVKETFEKTFRTKYGKIRELDKKQFSDKDINNFVTAGLRMIDDIDKCMELATAEVLFTEHKLMEPISRTDDVDIKFKGFIDIVIRTKNKFGKSVVWICDYKTCSWGWTKEKKTDEDLLAQLRLYKHFFSKKFNLDPKYVKTAFILLKRVPKKGEPAVQWLPISSGNKTTMRAVNNLNEAITGMNANDYKKNRNACINAFGDACPFKGTYLCVDDD